MVTVRLTDLSWELPSLRADVDVPLLDPFGAFEPDGRPDLISGPGSAEFDRGFET